MKDNSDWENISKEIKKILSVCQLYLSQETIDAAMHYIHHDEYEMAAEGLLLDIMELNPIPDCLKKEDCMKLAIACGLNHEVVFCSDFWKKITEFCR